MIIHQTILTDNMIANLDSEPSAEYVAEMKTRYERALTEAYRNAYPDADVEITLQYGVQGAGGDIWTDADDIHVERHLEEIASNVWDNLEWPDEDDGEDVEMVTIVEYDENSHTLYARHIDATAAAGELVLPGKPTDQQIRDTADEELCAPECGNFSHAEVEWVY